MLFDRIVLAEAKNVKIRQEETRFKITLLFGNIKNKKGVITNEYYRLLWSKQR